MLGAPKPTIRSARHARSRSRPARPRLLAPERQRHRAVGPADFPGRKLVLYFYPKDDTSGCTLEAVEFTARAADFEAADTVVLGISRDSVKSHCKFRDKHSLGILLLSDEDGAVTERFGVWVEKSMYGRKYMGIERATFLVDAAGDGRARLAQREGPGPRRRGAGRPPGPLTGTPAGVPKLLAVAKGLHRLPADAGLNEHLSTCGCYLSKYPPTTLPDASTRRRPALHWWPRLPRHGFGVGAIARKMATTT